MKKTYISIRTLLASAAIAATLLSAQATSAGMMQADASEATTLQASPADGPLVISPLFEYPIAPEELTLLKDKSDWLMDHFWDAMDFTTTSTVDQNALNDAFAVYTSAMIHASRDKALSSVNNLVGKIKNSPALMLQFTKAAEECMYGQRAVAWCDETYIPFLKGVTASKNVAAARKARYENQLNVLQKNAVGRKFPKLRLTLPNQRHSEFSATTPLTIVEVGNPDCDDCQFAKMKLEMASDIQQMIADGKLQIAFIVADAVPEDQADILALLAKYPESWTTGISYGADDLLDLRQTPSFYVLGKNGEILAKNLDVSAAVDKVRGLKK